MAFRLLCNLLLSMLLDEFFQGRCLFVTSLAVLTSNIFLFTPLPVICSLDRISHRAILTVGIFDHYIINYV